MKVVATFNASAGNESVGEMWTEAATFDETATLRDVLEWACIMKEYDVAFGLPGEKSDMRLHVNYKRNVTLMLAQEPKS